MSEKLSPTSQHTVNITQEGEKENTYLQASHQNKEVENSREIHMLNEISISS